MKKRGTSFNYHEATNEKITAREKYLWKHYVIGNKGYQREQKQSRKRNMNIAGWLCEIEREREREYVLWSTTSTCHVVPYWSDLEALKQ